MLLPPRAITLSPYPLPRPASSQAPWGQQAALRDTRGGSTHAWVALESSTQHVVHALAIQLQISPLLGHWQCWAEQRQLLLCPLCLSCSQPGPACPMHPPMQLEPPSQVPPPGLSSIFLSSHKLVTSRAVVRAWGTQRLPNPAGLCLGFVEQPNQQHGLRHCWLPGLGLPGAHPSDGTPQGSCHCLLPQRAGEVSWL